MLTTSVLHILDKLQLGTKVSGARSSEGFQSWFGQELASSPGPFVEKAREKLNEGVGLVRPAPGDLSPPTRASQRNVEEFMRVLEEVNKEERPPILDLFE